MGDRRRAATDRRIVRLWGAAEHNLRDVDVAFGSGVTAVVGVSGSGKSSLVFDTLYTEARRRFLETLSLGSPWLRLRPAKVRSIDGLGPAVAVAQSTVNRNPNSTLATAVGVHPYLRLLYARFAERRCQQCHVTALQGSIETQLAALEQLVAQSVAAVEVIAPLVLRAEGSHHRLLTFLGERFPNDAIEVDGARWDGAGLDPDAPHEIGVRIGTAQPGTTVSALRSLLDSVAALGTPLVTLRRADRSQTLSRAAVCTGCGARLPLARPQDFRGVSALTDQYRVGGRTLDEFLALDVRTANTALGETPLLPAARRVVDHVQRRLSSLLALGLPYLTLDRRSPTLSRGEAQRVRLAVILANRVEDLIHVVDEPTIGLDPAQVGELLAGLAGLRGPVILVEHDRWAVAAADDVVELGPGAGHDGGRVVFRGTPASLWKADTASGGWFSGRASPKPTAVRRLPEGWLTVRRAGFRNLAGIDCAFPVGGFTAVTGPSGAGKTTLVRDVLLASIEAGRPRGCEAVEGPPLRPVFVDQAPIGRNPRSNPATYTGLASRIRSAFARRTGLAASAFSFNRSEGACEVCRGMGAVEVKLAHLPSEWVTCESCRGRRFSAEIVAAVAELGGRRMTIAGVFEMSVEESIALLGGDPAARRILQALLDVGLGYLPLGQPSPTLSGGEAQRVKLAKQLATTRSQELIVLDEPTTGLHPANLAELVSVLRTLVERGSTVVVVEHNPDVVQAADWVIRLGPGGGPDGGRLLHAGPPLSGDIVSPRPRRTPRRGRRSLSGISIRRARANNLRNVSVTIPKDLITAVVGVSGSGKSSLVKDVLEAEASRRLLECLSMYERQSVREGPEARVESVVGLGPTLAIGPERRLWDPRATVGSATELSRHLGALFSYAGTRPCPGCGGEQRRSGPALAAPWRCPECGTEGAAAAPSDFSPSAYEAACLTCHGVGTIAVPLVERLIVRPDEPICGGAMHSPGFFPRSYLCRPENGGYWMLQMLARRYGFDPEQTPWQNLSAEAQEAFLYGEEQVEMPAEAARAPGRTLTWRGVLRIVSGWDIGGMYTERRPCPDCAGRRLRPQFLDVLLAGMNRHDVFQATIAEITGPLSAVAIPPTVPGWVSALHRAARRRLEFLERVGLGYVHLDRPVATLSAGEVQRVKLASILGSELTGMTVLLDEPSRGLHPSEVAGLGDALRELRDAANTVVMVDHDPVLVEGADHLVVLGPGAGGAGGRVVAAGPRQDVRGDSAAAPILDPPRRPAGRRRTPSGWMVVRKPTENNLVGEDVPLPLGVLVGLCGVSGSGKSTVAIDIVARVLAPPRLTTSVAHEEIRPGAHESIEGAPPRAIHADQSPAGIRSPGGYLGVLAGLRRRYADSAEAHVAGLAAEDLVPRCDGCGGRGSIRQDMSFLAPVEHACDACDATGYTAEARRLVVRGRSLPELEGLTLDQVLGIWQDHDVVARPLHAAGALGLGYLALGQKSLSGGERQRLKLTRELAKPASRPTLYILDEPTTGLHAVDTAQLAEALSALVGAGHTVLVVEHDPVLLACCDHLVELGPGGGPAGGRVIASGTPEQLASGDTPIAPHLRGVLR